MAKRKLKIYISRSNHVPDWLLLEGIDALKVWFPGCEITHHNREEVYTWTKIRESDMVFTLIGHYGDDTKSYNIVGKGTCSEAKYCEDNGKDNYLLYKLHSSKAIQIYNYSFEMLKESNYEKYALVVFRGNVTNTAITDLTNKYCKEDETVPQFTKDYPLIKDVKISDGWYEKAEEIFKESIYEYPLRYKDAYLKTPPKPESCYVSDSEDINLEMLLLLPR